MLLGSHLSIAGGLHNALEKAHAFGFDCMAMFLRNQMQWRAAPLSETAVTVFRRRREELRIGPIVAHGSYLVNLAGSGDVRRMSIDAMSEDLTRCDRLGVEMLVFHPGANEDADDGIILIADALDFIVATPRPAGAAGLPPTILLETTAGQGYGIGHTFEQLADIIARLEQPERVAVCLDTCHVFAAGYDVRTPPAYRKTMLAFDRTVGMGKLRAIHLNDARKGLASRVDRHAHIGLGEITDAGFANFVNDRRLAKVPMILETPKELDEHGRDWDIINAERVRSLVKSRKRAK